MNKHTILYVEDDETLAFLTKDNLEQNGYEVLHCARGNDVLPMFKKHKVDVCILDIMLPEKDGFELATEIRQHDAEVPILFLSAKTLKEDRIKGLKLGADDYIVKPFSIEELLLKVEIFLKRAKKTTASNHQFKLGKYLFDANNYTLTATNEKTISLTQREASVLKLLAQNQNNVLARETILKSIWGEDDYFMGRSLDVFISRLRKILIAEPCIQIENLHGVGFRFCVKEASDK